MTIRDYREAHGMTQAELASAIGVPQNNVSRWERGTVSPSADTLRKLAAVFNCRMDEITPSVRRLKMRDVLTRDGYDGLTADERRAVLKAEQAKEYSGWRRYPTTCDRLVERIPDDWWDTYSAQHIGEVMSLLKSAYDDGIAYGRTRVD